MFQGELNAKRKECIGLAYNKLDKTKDGKVTLEDIAALYDASKHPEIISKKKTPEQVYTEYMSHWDTQIADGIITREEFEDYYQVTKIHLYKQDISALIDSDDYFIQMIKSAWKL